MKKFLRILVPVLLSVVIIICSVWYLFEYDRGLTRDILLSCARNSERIGYHNIATWFYNRAYSHDGNSDAVAIELAQQYINNGNYTKAEYTLSNAISDGGGIDVYIKLCKTFVEQDKLIDAVNMLDSVNDTQIKAQLEKIRPSSPIFTPDSNDAKQDQNGKDTQNPIEYDQYITVSLSSKNGTVYAARDGAYPSISSPYSESYTMNDGVNTIRAVTISDNGLVSRFEERKYVVHGVVEEVAFVDAAIEAEIRKILGVNESKTLMTRDLWTITDFTVPIEAKAYDDLRHMLFIEKLTIIDGVSGQLSSIDLAGMSRLHTLSISNTAVSQSDLSLIASIPDLRELTLSSTGISGISPLKEAVKLDKLDLSGNSIGVLDPIKYLPQLKELNLSNNAVTDLSALSKNAEIHWLDVSLNQIVTLAPVTSLEKLTYLNAANNRVSVLGDIGKLTRLSELYLNNNRLTSLENIELCTELTAIDLTENQLTDISGLSTMKELKHLNFSKNLVTELPDFSKECGLVSIDGSFNLISDLTELSGLNNLNTVNMQGNTELTSIEPLADCHNLFRVNVLDTKVTEVTILTDKSISVLYRQAEVSIE